MDNPHDCTFLSWDDPKSSRSCALKPDQKIVDFNIILTGTPDDIDHILEHCPDLPIDKNPERVESLSLDSFLTEEICQLHPGLGVYRPLQVRVYDLVGEESEKAVWQAINQVHSQAAKDHKLVFADPNYITADPEGGSGGSGWIQGGSGSGGSGGVQGGPSGSGGSGGVQGGPDGNVGGKSVDEAFMEHWAFYPTRGISLENGRGLRMNTHNKGQSAEVFIFDTVDKRIDEEIDLKEHYPERTRARKHIRIERGYPSEPLEICISSPAERFNGKSQRTVYIESSGKVQVDEHGLFVAGLIHRIAPRCQLRLVDILNQYGQGELFGLLRALTMLAKHGVKRFDRDNQLKKPLQQTIVNLSLGVSLSEEAMTMALVDDVLEQMRDGAAQSSTAPNTVLVSILDSMLMESHYVASLRVIIKLLHELGAIIVAAAGNDSARVTGDLPSQIPACYPEVISVAASVFNGKKANYSNRGDVMAPGGGSDVLDVTPAQTTPGWKIDESEFAILSVVPRTKEEESGYALWRGTSFAVPMVSGLIAMLIEKMAVNEVYLSSRQIKKLLANRSRDGVIDIQMALDGIEDR